MPMTDKHGKVRRYKDRAAVIGLHSYALCCFVDLRLLLINYLLHYLKIRRK